MTSRLNLPKIILGGMGVAVSWWQLVRAACTAAFEIGLDFLGIVSLTAIGDVAVRRLQLGDKDMLRALMAFPIPEIAAEIKAKFFIEGGKNPKTSFINLPMFTLEPSKELVWINIFGGFAEVWLAKEGHKGRVGVNILEKIQPSIIYALLGAMWAGTDAIVVGAGLPVQIPEVIDAILDGREISYKLTVAGDCEGKEFFMRLSLDDLLSGVSSESQKRVKSIELKLPWFFPIVTLAVTAQHLYKRLKEKITGFIVEERIAGGHNASPRDKNAGISEFGEPIYGNKDEVKYDAIAAIGLPFWPAGGFVDREKRKELSKYGPTGFQIGGAFAICDETGVDSKILATIRHFLVEEKMKVLATSISSSGFPFQTGILQGSIAENRVREGRKKRCNLGYLRQGYCDENGNLRFRCSAEDPEVYVAKGGKLEDTIGKGCLCNALMSTVGLGQVYADGYCEPAVVTFSKDGHEIMRRLLIENRGRLPVKKLLMELTS